MGALVNTSKFVSSTRADILFGLVIAGAIASGRVHAAASLVAGGAQHSCAVAQGKLYCWGDNSSGQLGNGTFDSIAGASAVSDLGNDVTAITVGLFHTCAIAHGSAVCWGSDGFGELGDGDGTPTGASAIPVHVIDVNSGTTAISSKYLHTCAVANSGLVCWGDNTYGQLGTGDSQSRNAPVAVFDSDSGITDVGVGSGHTCAIKNGNVYCWGKNDLGQLGTGDYQSSMVPELNGVSGAIAVVAGVNHTCALLDSGEVHCWGAGPLGNGNSLHNNEPQTVLTLLAPPNLTPLNGVSAIAAGYSHTCAIAATGFYCWGFNEHGQLGLSSTARVDALIATPLSLSDQNMIEGFGGGADHICALIDSAPYCWGSDEYRQLGQGQFNIPPIFGTPIPSSASLVNLSAGGAHICGLAAGHVACLGSNRDGELGNGTRADQTVPQDVVLNSSATQVSAGLRHSCAVTTNGSVACWGANDYRQLGVPVSEYSAEPVFVADLGGVGTQVSAGASHTCAAVISGAQHIARCWGTGGNGQLGNGTTVNTSPPVTVLMETQFPIPLGSVTEVTTGGGHSCAITSTGIRCWGANFAGQLGDGSTTTRTRAVSVTGLPPGSAATHVAAGDVHTCAIVSDAAMCWGSNGDGQLGNNSAFGQSSSVPVNVMGLESGVTSIVAGNEHACALQNGTVKCWGRNAHGQLGDGTFTRSNVPVDVTGLPPGITGLAAGEEFTCATAAGEAWCWGSAMFGRLGNGVLGYSPVPLPVDIDTIWHNGFDPPSS